MATAEHLSEAPVGQIEERDIWDTPLDDCEAQPVRKSSMRTKMFNCPKKTDNPCWGLYTKKNG